MASLGFSRVGGLVLTARSLVVLLAASACIPRVPVQRLPALTPIVVAYVVDPSYSGEATTAPGTLKAAVAEVLAERNLRPVELPLEVVKDAKLTDARMAAMRANENVAPFLLLVELRVQFFSQLDGRYRWEVGTAVTAERRSSTQVKDAFEVPVVLQFDHEKQPAAIVMAADDIKGRVAVLIDGLLASPGAQTTTRATTELTRPQSIYFVMVDRFENGSKENDGTIDLNDPAAFHGGDLDGVISRLDWLQALGVDTVWLSPIFAMRTGKWHGFGAFHGYWTHDLASVEPRFGTEATLAKLSNEIHRRGMKLLLDLVLNHVGPDAPLLKAHPEWFHSNGGVTDWSNVHELENGDVHGLSDLAQENPEVAAYLSAATRRWLRAGQA